MILVFIFFILKSFDKGKKFSKFVGRMERLKIAVICGGDSSEKEVSLRSGAQVFESLDRTKYDPTLVEISAKGWWASNSGQPIDKNDFSVEGQPFDYALIMIHGTPGENGVLQGYLDLLKVPYSSPSLDCSALTFNKTLCKLAVRAIEGINLSREIVIRRGEKIDTNHIIKELGLPLFVKPNASGSSCGVSKVKCEQDIEQAVREALKEGDVVLLEEYIQGMEVSQGVMICRDEEFVLPITELVSHNEFFDYQAKYTVGMSEEITPARLDDDVAQRVSCLTLAIYKTLACKGVVRVDYIIKEGRPYFIEVNTVPGMSAQSIIPQQWAAIGLTMGQGFDKIIESTYSKR